ncbi:MAG: dTDP-4-dehydrorhamnose 3,5-epimerase family protein [SAR324 cluster bacterium]|nr:dTDP-4-dehydrorhamnose 3,5-epimerase family protein [SAR324 cluster bacterium]
MEYQAFTIGEIEGVVIENLKKFEDDRGWLCELFRHDELDEKYFPAMSYISLSKANIVRGPHEHVEQTDLFAFLGPGTFEITLWDNRKESSTYWNKMVFSAGESSPLSVLVPPGIVHAYQNLSSYEGVVLNFPNQLFMGKNKKFPVDEIRHEIDPDSVFKI